MYRVMLISKDSAFLDQAGGFLNRLNSEIRVLPVKDPAKVDEVLESSPHVDIFVCDHDPPKVDGFSIFSDRNRKKDMRPFIILALHGNEELAAKAFEHRVDYYINRDKPPMNLFMELASKVVVSVEKWRVESERVLTERRLKALVKLAKMHNHTFNEILNYALEESVSLTGSGMGYVALYDAEKRRLTMHAWSHAGMEACKMNHRPIDYELDSTGIWGDPVRLKQIIVVNDYNAPNPHKGGIPMGHAPLNRLLMVPIMHNGEVVGTAGVANKREEYNQSDQDQFILLMEGLVGIYLERALKEETTLTEKRLRDVLSSAPVGIIVLDDSLNIMECNGFARELISVNNLNTSPMSIKSYDNDIASTISQMIGKINSIDSTRSEEMSIGGDTLKHIRIGISPTHQDSGKITGFVVVLEDVTDLKDATIKLESALYQMNILDQITYGKINTSLDNIRASLQNDTADGISNAVDDIEGRLGFYREYKNIGIFSPEWQNVKEVAEYVARSFTLPEEMMNIRLEGIRVLADPALKNVFHHLIANSLEHGQKVTDITISYRIQNGYLTILYKDDGVGVPYGLKKILFDPPNGERDMLGMFLIRNILSVTKMTIREVGIPGEGALFEIRVPSSHYAVY